MRARLLILALICLPLMAGAKVYKWVDKDGNVHFTESPPPEDAAQSEEVDTSRSQRSESQRQEAMRLQQGREPEAEASPEDMDAAALARQKALEEQMEREYQEKRKVACNSAKVNLQMLQSGGRIYDEDEDGNRTYLDDRERTQRIEHYQGKVDQYCGPEKN
jgi:hypothetical protein